MAKPRSLRPRYHGPCSMATMRVPGCSRLAVLQAKGDKMEEHMECALTLSACTYMPGRHCSLARSPLCLWRCLRLGNTKPHRLTSEVPGPKSYNDLQRARMLQAGSALRFDMQGKRAVQEGTRAIPSAAWEVNAKPYSLPPLCHGCSRLAIISRQWAILMSPSHTESRPLPLPPALFPSVTRRVHRPSRPRLEPTCFPH